jgi:hypothetical protein
MFKPIKTVVRSAALKFGYTIAKQRKTEYSGFSFEFSETDKGIIKAVKPFTQSSYDAIFALIQAVRYIITNRISGDFVECGVFKGGSMMAMALALRQSGVVDRDVFLFDTFEGMPKPDDVDVSPIDGKGSDWFNERQTGPQSSNWTLATLDEVKERLSRTGYGTDRMHFIKGLVEETIPYSAPQTIALLRLDTDFYSSTRHELIHLFPRLSVGGVIIIDDYASWFGARKATDEYFQENRVPILLNRIDFTGARIGVKLRD